MAETLSANVKIACNATLTGDSDLGGRDYSLGYKKTLTFTHGTGLNQANQIWTDTRQIAASGSDDIDLAGVLTSPLGTTLTFTKIKSIIVYAYDTNVNNVVIGGDANGLVNWVGNVNDVVNLRPGGFICLAAPDATGYAVVASTGDILQIANSGSGTAVDYDIIVIGCV